MKDFIDSKRRSSMLAAAAGAALLLAGTLTANASGGPSLADMEIAPDLVQWVPGQAADGAGIALSVSTPSGEVVSHTFSADEVPAYPVDAGDSLDDGSYTYELYLVRQASAPKMAAVGGGSSTTDENGRPVGAVRTAKSAKSAAVGGYSKRGSVQSGYFTVMDGIILDPNVAE